MNSLIHFPSEKKCFFFISRITCLLKLTTTVTGRPTPTPTSPCQWGPLTLESFHKFPPDLEAIKVVFTYKYVITYIRSNNKTNNSYIRTQQYRKVFTYHQSLLWFHAKNAHKKGNRRTDWLSVEEKQTNDPQSDRKRQVDQRQDFFHLNIKRIMSLSYVSNLKKITATTRWLSVLSSMCSKYNIYNTKP